jgi:uncharacterized damage-inducible protein DinB
MASLDRRLRHRGTKEELVDQEKSLREQLSKLLDWKDAHANFDQAVNGADPEKYGQVPPGFAHSLWQLLEHIRRCQFDILDFCRNPKYKEPSSMDDYWPPSVAPPSKEAWRESVASVRRDREALMKLAMDQRIDLFARIPHGSGQTYLRELILVADHNAYHVGQIVATRRALGNWSTS